VVISHGAESKRTDRSRFQLEFGWTGTFDPTPYLCIPTAVEFLGSLHPGGFAEHMKKNHELAVAARRRILDALSVPEPCPESMLGSMASIPLPENLTPPPSASARYDPLQTDLWERDRIEVPVVPWPSHPHRLVRISAQAYNRIEQYDQLARALTARVVK
jgi:isopenicillin-N epimerase